MLRTAQHPVEHPHPDAARIAGIGAAIVFNAALLLMLSRPIELAYQSTRPELTPPLRLVDIVKPRPEVLPVEKHRIVQPAQPTPRADRTPVITRKTTPVSTQTDPPADQTRIDTQPPQARIDSGADATPIEASLATLTASPPPYPRLALRDGIEGTVQLLVLVDETGHVLEVKVERSSGDHQLDTAAREHVLRHWLFQPAQRNGVPMRAWARAPIEFRLDGR